MPTLDKKNVLLNYVCKHIVAGLYSVMGRISAGVILRNSIRMTRVLTDQLPDLQWYLS